MALLRHAAWLLLLAMPAARAQVAAPPDHPFVVPQHDVDVLYAVPLPTRNEAPALTQRMRFSAGPLLQRVDPPGSDTYMITDYGSARLIVVQPQQQVATTLPAPGAPIARPGIRASGDYRRLGARTVAGVACTDWSTRDLSGTTSTICLTDDGVMLRATQQGRVLLQAQSVSYAPQDPAVFRVPSGYRLQSAAAPQGGEALPPP